MTAMKKEDDRLNGNCSDNYCYSSSLMKHENSANWNTNSSLKTQFNLVKIIPSNPDMYPYELRTLNQWFTAFEASLLVLIKRFRYVAYSFSL